MDPKFLVTLTGIILIVTGGIFTLKSIDASGVLASGYAMAFGFPESKLPVEQKITKSLQDEITRRPRARIPIIIKLTGEGKTLAIMQQKATLETLQTYGFKMTGNMIYLSNMIAGTIQADKIDDIAADPNVEKIFYDQKFKVDLEDVKIHLLSQSVPQIHANEVWNEGYTGKGVTVIVIDTGIQNNHPYLMRNGKSIVIDEHSFSGVMDYGMDHGTHVAGIVASQKRDCMGVAPDVDLVDLIALDKNGNAMTSWLLEAMDYAYHICEMKTAVVTCSWGVYPYDTYQTNELRYAALKLARVCPVVFAAGNEGSGVSKPYQIDCPADADDDQIDIITVGAVDKSGHIAWFSSRGPDWWGNDHNEPDLVAPGVDIRSTVPNGFEKKSGTSMAAPHVAGVIALMLSKNPHLSHKDCYNILTETAEGNGFNYNYGYGMVRADYAIDATPFNIIPSNPVSQIESPLQQLVYLTMVFTGIILVIDAEEISNMINRRC